MSQLTVGDLSQSLILSRRNATLKDAIADLMTEATTGMAVKQTEHLQGDYALAAGIEASLSQIAAFRLVNAETGAIAGHMQIALGGIADNTAALASSLLAASTGNSPQRVDMLGDEAGLKLQSAMATLNTRLGAISLFSGKASDHAAVADTEDMMLALDALVAGAVSAVDVETALDDWFADPAGFEATVYQGGDALAAVPVGRDQTAQIDVTALDPAIVATLKGLAMASLLSRGVLSGSPVARADLARRAGEGLTSNQSAMVELQARLGLTEAAITTAAVQNDAERSALETARLGLLAVDPYETAAKLQEAQSQLETLFSITARMSRLSLVTYL